MTLSLYVAYPKNIVTSRILDDDYVTVYGTSLGLYSYQSTMGGKITVPALYLDRIELQNKTFIKKREAIDFSFLLFTILNPLISITFHHKFINFVKHYKFLQAP